MKKSNTFTPQDINDKTPSQPIFASVPKVSEPYRLHIPQQRLYINYQTTGPPNTRTNNSTQTNTINAGNHINTNPQTYANNINANPQTNNNHRTTGPPNARTHANNNPQPATHQRRNWNCSINSFQQTISTQETPAHYTSRHPRGHNCYYSTYTNSIGSKTVNTNNISITSN